MAELEPGAIFAGHRIEGIAGRGGFGVVYRATHIHLDHVVALKLISSGRGGEQTFRDRFISESRIAVSIRHPNVVAVHNAGEEDGLLYVTMDFIDGTDLRGLLNREGRLDPEDAVAIMRQLAAALDAAHEKGLVHRDIKPGNVLLDERGGGRHVYLTDFGLSKQMDATSGVTATGAFVGTLDYVAPEQIKGDRLDARTDVYALGCVMFELLSGDIPFTQEEKVAKIYAHLQEQPPELIDAAPEVPSALSEVVWRAMAKDPEDRHPSAGDFARAAAAAVEGRQPSEPERNVGVGAAAPTQAYDMLAAAAAGAAIGETVESAPPTDAGGETVAVPPPGAQAGSTAEVAPPAGSAGGETVAVPPPAQQIPPAEADVTPEASTPGETITVPPPGAPSGGGDTPATPAHTARPKRGGAGKVIVAMIALLALAGGAYAVLGGGSKEEGGSGEQQSGGNGGGGDSGGGSIGPIEVAEKPVGVDVDDNGVVWVSSRDGQELTRIDSESGEVLGTEKLDGSGEQVNIDPDGIAWVAVSKGDGANGEVVRFDPDGKQLDEPIPVGIDPRGVAGGDKNQWVINLGSNDTSRIDRKTFDVTPIGLGVAPARAAEGGDAALGIWVSNSGDDSVSRITELGDVVSTVFGIEGTPRGIVAEGADVWVVGQDSNQLYRITPASPADAKATGTAGEIRATTDLSKVCEEPRSIAAANDVLWITCGTSDNVAQVDAESGQLIGKGIGDVGPDPEGIAVDDNGGVWVSSGGKDPESDPGIVTFIDPKDVD
jgi:streptogramin lyase